MNSTPKSLLDQAFTVMITVVLIAIGLSWAWHLVRPLLPVFVGVAVVVVIGRYLRVRNQW